MDLDAVEQDAVVAVIIEEHAIMPAQPQQGVQARGAFRTQADLSLRGAADQHFIPFEDENLRAALAFQLFQRMAAPVPLPPHRVGAANAGDVAVCHADQNWSHP